MLKDIIGIDYGTSSSAYLWSLYVRKGAKTSSEPFASPWRCFTVRTLTKTFEFRAQTDEVAQEYGDFAVSGVVATIEVMLLPKCVRTQLNSFT